LRGPGRQSFAISRRPGIRSGRPSSAVNRTNGYWDTQFVEAVARPPAALAKQLLAQITSAQEAEWKQGSPDDWAMEAFNIAFDDVS
jgi:hypothetical protein